MAPRSASPVSLLAGGDWVLRRGWRHQREAGAASTEKFLRDLSRWDLVVGNLEIALSRRGTPGTKVSTVNLRADPEIAADLKRFSFDAVSLANNHTMDYGSLALRDTIDAVHKAGIRTFGAGRSVAAALAPLVMTVRGLRVAMIGISCTLPPGSAAGSHTPGVAPLRIVTSMDLDPGLLMEQPGSAPRMRTAAVPEDLDYAVGRVTAAQELADVVLVFIHWGVPPQAISTFLGPELADYQQPVGRALIDAGAHAVIGHHAHVIHGIEVYRGRPIVYGLGNMVFEEPPWFMPKEGILAALDLEQGRVRELRVLPLQMTANGLPRTATARETAAIFSETRRQSAAFGTEFEAAGAGALRVSLRG